MIIDYSTNWNIYDITFGKRSEFRQLDDENSKKSQEQFKQPSDFKSRNEDQMLYSQGPPSHLPSQNQEESQAC